MVGVKMFFSLSLRFHCNYVFFMAMIQCTLPVNKTKKYSNGWVHFSTLHIIIPYNCVFLLKTLFGVRPSLSIEVKWRFKILWSFFLWFSLKKRENLKIWLFHSNFLFFRIIHFSWPYICGRTLFDNNFSLILWW